MAELLSEEHSYSASPLYVVSRCIPPAQAGGGRRALRQARYWSAHAGRDVTLLTSTPRSEPAGAGVEVEVVDLAGWYTDRSGGTRTVMKNLRLLARLWRALGRGAARRGAVVYVMGGSSWFALLSVLAARLRGLKTVIEPGTMDSGDALALSQGRLGALKLALFDRAHAVVNLSPTAARRACAAGIATEKQYLIPNSVDTDAFAPPLAEEKARLRGKLGLGSVGGQVLLSVGAVRPRKDTKALVEMFARVAETHPESALVLAGPLEKDAESTRYAAEVRELVQAHGLSGRVVFPGAVENVAEWMKASDAFVFASRSEGFGTVVVEAMATGLPVVAMEIPEVTRYILTDGEDGRVATSEEGFAEAVQAVLGASVEERAATGRRARRTAEARFSHAVVMQQYLALFDAL